MEGKKLLFDYLNKLSKGRPIFDPVPEELQRYLPNFDVPSEDEEEDYYIELPKEDFGPVKVEDNVEPVHFSAFLDGVQRTQVYHRETLPNGARVPIFIAHIAVGVVLREDKKLKFDDELFEHRYLLVLPYEGIKEETKGAFPEPPLRKGDDEEITCFETEKEAFWSDITMWLGGKGGERLSGEKLLESYKIRARARTRVGAWRQMLELYVLKRFVEKYPDRWILVDGPLYYDYRWTARLNIGREEFIDKAKYVVGYIKAPRERPKNLSLILKLDLSQRSPVRRWRKTSVPKEGHFGEERKTPFPRSHLKWYIRQRIPPRGWTPPDYIGLAAIDIDIITLGLNEEGDNLTPDKFETYRPVSDSITSGIWQERLPNPSFPMDFSYYVRLYPIEKLERTLHSCLLPPRMLATAGIWRHTV